LDFVFFTASHSASDFCVVFRICSRDDDAIMADGEHPYQGPIEGTQLFLAGYKAGQPCPEIHEHLISGAVHKLREAFSSCNCY
jgi:hypothetical protein